MEVERPVILIGGVPRTGKSRTARRIAALTGFDVIHCDQIRQSFWTIADEQQRAAARLKCYAEAIADRRGGLIIEGDDLVFRNPGDAKLARQGVLRSDRRLCLELIEVLRAGCGARAFLIGCIEAKPEIVEAAIRQHETETCFTTALSDDALRGFIRTSIVRSRRLRDMATQAGIAYVEMGEGDFDDAVEAAAIRALQGLDRIHAQVKGQE
jgi:predicted kinase